MAADRGPYICQSQSFNVHIQDPNFGKLTSMHFYAWKKGLKTGMYYLRSTAAADAIKFTVDKSKLAQPVAQPATAAATSVVKDPVAEYAVAENQQAIPYQQSDSDYEQKRADMSCSLDNPDACEACGS